MSYRSIAVVALVVSALGIGADRARAEPPRVPSIELAAKPGRLRSPAPELALMGRLVVDLQLTGGWMKVSGYDLGGGAVRAQIGSRWDRFALVGEVALGVMGRESLRVVPWVLGVTFDVQLGAVRLGLGPEVALFGVPRLTSSEELVFAGLGAHATFAVDMRKVRDWTLSFNARASATGSVYAQDDRDFGICVGFGARR